MEKTAKNPFVGGRDGFEERGRLTTKINITFFMGTEVLNIFHLTILKKKKNNNHISRNNSAKSFWWWEHDYFLRERGVGRQK